MVTNLMIEPQCTSVFNAYIESRFRGAVYK
jgi:hypothetical protein